MLKITPAISFFLLAAVVMTDANGVEKGSSGKPGLLRTAPRDLQVKKGQGQGQGQVKKGQGQGTESPTASKAAKGSKGVKVTICHHNDNVDARCPWKEITVGKAAQDTHVEMHGDFDGTCEAKCESDGGVYNSVTCACDFDSSVRFLQVADADEWGRQV